MMVTKNELEFYSEEWSQLFSQEKENLRDALQNDFMDAYHIGSTAVRGIFAKPRIDIAVIVRDLSQSLLLKDHGYQFKGEFNIPFRFFFSKSGREVGYNLHVMSEGNHELDGFISFRDFLNQSEWARHEYSECKQKIKSFQHQKSEAFMFNEYTLAKNEVIRKIIAASGFNKVCMRFVSHYCDLEFEKTVCDQHKISLHPSDVRVVLYKGANIIGYAVARENDIAFLNSSESREEFEKYLRKYIDFKTQLIFI